MAVYKCRLCDRAFHHEMDVVGIFSNEGKKEKIAAKILYALTIMVSENDPTSQYICKVCHGHVDVNVRFAATCHQTNSKIWKSLMTKPTNYQYKEEINKILKIPIPSLYNQNPILDIDVIYKYLLNYMRDSGQIKIAPNKPGHGPGQSILNQLHSYTLNSVHSTENDNIDNLYQNGLPELSNLQLEKPDGSTNGGNSENNAAIANGTLESLLLSESTSNKLQVNMNCISKLGSGISNINQSITNVPNIGMNSLRKKKRPLTVNKLNLMTNKASIEDKEKKRRCVSSFDGKNQPSKNVPIIVTNVNNDHTYYNYDAHKQIEPSTVKNPIIDDEVICVDDDDDDDDLQLIENDVSPLNKWVINNTKNHTKRSKTNISKTDPNDLPIFRFQRKLIPIAPNPQLNSTSSTTNLLPNTTEENPTQNRPTRCSSRLSNVSAEEMTVTPDIALPINSIFTTNHPENIVVLLPSNAPPLVTAETGYHFLSPFFSSESPTVDLTSTDDTPINTCYRTPYTVNRKRKSTKFVKEINTSVSPAKKNCRDPINTTLKTINQEPSTSNKTLVSSVAETIIQVPVPSKTLRTKNQTLPTFSNPTIVKTNFEETNPSSSQTNRPSEMVPKLRSTRASATNNSQPINAGLSKLKHQSDSSGWTVQLKNIFLPVFQCPFCIKYYYSPTIREKHENKDHLLPPLPPSTSTKSPDSFSDLDNLSTEQQDFLISLNLIKKTTNKTNMSDRLAGRTHLLKALTTFGNKAGVYKCRYCLYKTSRMHILWAHMSANHAKLDSDVRSTNSFCFMCERVLGRRTKVLKHLDKCTGTQQDEETPSGVSPEILRCNYCNAEIQSLTHLEKHLWDHVS